MATLFCPGETPVHFLLIPFLGKNILRKIHVQTFHDPRKKTVEDKKDNI